MNKIIKVRPNQKTVLEINQSGILRARVEKNGLLQIFYCIDKMKNFTYDAIIELVGAGASCKVTGAFHGKGNDNHNFNILMYHKTGRTKGDILLKAVYENKARGRFSGLIKIDKKAQQTNSYFSDHVLLADEGQAESDPTLEIEANDVRASHGSTTGRIDQNQIFYLGSRGLTPAQARQMVINGFLAAAKPPRP